MNYEPARTCPYCAESIRTTAKVCPRCRQWLTLRSWRNPVVFVVLHSVPLLFVWFAFGMFILVRLDRLQNPKPYYADFPGALKITTSRMHCVETRDGVRIYLTGTLTNQSAVAWRGVEFDCRFFDRAGNLIDAGNGRGSFTSEPFDETAFRIAVEPMAATNDYAGFELLVSSARNAVAWP